MTLLEYIIIQLLLIFWAIYVIKNNPIKSNPSDKADYNYSQYSLVSNIISVVILSVILLIAYIEDESVIIIIWNSIKGFVASIF